ncbi:thiol-disulfide oxidoreductase ResA [Bacillus alkalicellulosilyticus]|uniref:thiol-disulfide oxidoreductase ResA n=1 Tax=Alkalihalobacterium alkalicellulosilyticum TaxID=1912214 RepID=UPI000997B25B|nr:thiol-disulfide oxidoreductase ResA [Bacillus alkalicellulosilyticus]
MKQKRLLVRSSILCVIAAALLYTFYSNFIADKSVVKVGEEPVNFIVTTLDGEQIELRDLRGQGVFLNFWGTYCPPCEKEMPYMESLYEVYKDQGVEIIALNVNEPELTVQRFVDRLDLTFPIALDKGDKIVRAYGIRPLPTTVLINPDGLVEKVHLGGMTEDQIREFMELIKPEV